MKQLINGMHVKAKFIDKDFGEWYARPQSVLYQKSSHPKRGLLKISNFFTKSIDEVEKMLFDALGDAIKIKKETYVNLQKKCTFIDKDYGEWIAYPYNVIHQKQRHPKRKSLTISETWLKKYGVPHISQNEEIHNKMINSLQNVYLVPHWKINEILKCQSSWEKAVVEWLNENKINYEWHPKKFTTPFLTKLGYFKKYTPDLYFPDKNIWVEIKGRPFPKSMEKWEWFHKEYPNSELWNKEKLKSLGIKVK